MSAPVLILALSAAALGQQEADPPPAPAGRQEQLALFKQQVAELSLYGGPDATGPLPLHPEPVLRYTNAERDIGSLDGATFLWLEGPRPIAAVSYSIRRLRNEVYRECTSLSPSPLVCRTGEAPLWSPKTGGLLAQRLAGAPAPAAGKVQRLTQMRGLARRFAAGCYHRQTDQKTQLRLLPQPLFRFADEKEEVIDGGLFAFVVSNDPELFLLLEAKRGAQEGEDYWRYSLARMSSQELAVRLDDKEIWSVANYWQDPTEDRKTGPYVEAKIGTFVSAAPPPSDR